MVQTIEPRGKEQFWPRRINQYVPACQFHSDYVPGMSNSINLGTPAVADTDGLLDGVDASAAGTITVAGNAALGAIGAVSDAPYGRNVTMTANGASTAAVTVKGRDYLGQPMSESLVGSSGADAGVKAFMYVDELITLDTDGDSDADFGWGDVLGLPVKVLKVLAEEADGVIETTLGTLVGPVLTDPQTLVTGDPRGTYNPQTTLDGSVEITIHAIVSNDINASDNGGFFGIAQFYA